MGDSAYAYYDRKAEEEAKKLEKMVEVRLSDLKLWDEWITKIMVNDPVMKHSDFCNLHTLWRRLQNVVNENLKNG